MRKIPIILLLLSILMSCQKTEILTMSITPIKRGTVMDPSKIYFLNEYYLIENLSVRLVEMDARAGYKMMLASSIDQISDVEYKIQIKETYFSNGELITIEDVYKSFQRASHHENSHVAMKTFVDEITIDGKSLKIKLKKRVNDFYYLLSLADLSVLHSSQVNKKEILIDDWLPVSSGPYTYVIDGEETFLKKNMYFKLTEINYPEKIKLVTSRGKDSFEEFKKGSVDFGEFNLNSYEKHIDELGDVSSLQVIGNPGDMITYLALNINNKKFKSESTRQWLQKKMISEYRLDTKYQGIAQKAYQFLTPMVKGFVSEDEIIKEVNSWSHIDLSKIPKELEDGIVISTYSRAFEVTLSGAFEKLEKTLGIKIQIKNNVPATEYQKFIDKGDYEAFLGITSMDQVIVGEAITLKYFSSSPLFKDPTKKIKTLMEKYQHADPANMVSIVNKISVQMLNDSECIPLFYVASPFFYNKDKLDISGLDEMTYFNLWKIKEI